MGREEFKQRLKELGISTADQANQIFDRMKSPYSEYLDFQSFHRELTQSGKYNCFEDLINKHKSDSKPV